ncbi:hypothetical protein D3C72_2455590 [compost metagenome]
MRAAIPDETNCSAQTTKPLPPTRSKRPTTEDQAISRPLGREWRAARPKAIIRRPAKKKRRPAITKGGRPSTAKRMAR